MTSTPQEGLSPQWDERKRTGVCDWQFVGRKKLFSSDNQGFMKKWQVQWLGAVAIRNNYNLIGRCCEKKQCVKAVPICGGKGSLWETWCQSHFDVMPLSLSCCVLPWNHRCAPPPVLPPASRPHLHVWQAQAHHNLGIRHRRTATAAVVDAQLKLTDEVAEVYCHLRGVLVAQDFVQGAHLQAAVGEDCPLCICCCWVVGNGGEMKGFAVLVLTANPRQGYQIVLNPPKVNCFCSQQLLFSNDLRGFWEK